MQLLTAQCFVQEGGGEGDVRWISGTAFGEALFQAYWFSHSSHDCITTPSSVIGTTGPPAVLPRDSVLPHLDYLMLQLYNPLV